MERVEEGGFRNQLPVHINYDKLLIKRAQVRERTLDGTREQPNVTLKNAKNTFTTTMAQR